MTTITTAIGLAPLIFEKSAGGLFLVPMAVSIAFGLIFGTLLTLGMLPAALLTIDDMGRVFREGVDIDVHVNNLLKSGSRHTISQTDEIAVRLMNNPAYKQAVREGVVPSSVQQVVYQARDKICKNAIQETFDPWGKKHYWIGGGTVHWSGGVDTDEQALNEGYISVTPIQLDLTNHAGRDYLKNHWKM